MITLKFGGTSMANARRILASSEIILNRAKEDRISVIVSAVAGVSNSLQSAIDATTTGISGQTYVSDLRNIHNDICLELQSKLSGFDAEKVMVKLEPNFVELEKLLAGCVSFGGTFIGTDYGSRSSGKKTKRNLPRCKEICVYDRKSERR